MNSPHEEQANGNALPSTAAAPFPFSDPGGDCVLQTSDDVLFHVHKAVLSLVSNVFEGMFKIPPADIESQNMHNGLPLIQVSDRSTFLYDFLLWCDPRSTEISTTMDSLKNALAVADKYGCDSLIQRIGSFICFNTQTWQHEPLVAYSLAVRYRLDSVIPVAARMCLKISMSQWPENNEMVHITGLAMHNLMDYHFRAAAAASSAATDLTWVARGVYPMSYFATSCSGERDCRTAVTASGKWLAWFVDYTKAVAEALQVTPVSEMSRDQKLLTSVHGKISTSGCANCHIRGHMCILEFSEALALEISKRVERVSSSKP